MPTRDSMPVDDAYLWFFIAVIAIILIFIIGGFVINRWFKRHDEREVVADRREELQNKINFRLTEMNHDIKLIVAELRVRVDNSEEDISELKVELSKIKQQPRVKYGK